jgi:hypothetical protein
MKRKLLFRAGVILMALLPCGASAQIHFTASLDGAQEGTVVTNATGTGSFDLSEDFSQLHWVISYQGLSGPLSIGAHFHTGLPGVAGPVVKTIASGGRPAFSTLSGTWSTSDGSSPLTPALVDSLLAGKVYVNFHTTANPGGEIRGQVNLATSLHFEASFSGAQETPPNTFKGGGTAVVVLDKGRRQIDYWITYRGLSDSATGGHFHTGAAGVGGSVVRSLFSGKAPNSTTMNGSWKFTDGVQPLTNALIDSLVSGNMYLNFHTANNPGGEIRGQLILKGGTGFVASMDGAHEVPAKAFPGTGTGSFILNAARSQVSYNITYIGLSTNITGGHIHVGAPGVNGGVVKPLGTVGDSSEFTDVGTWKTTDASSALTTAIIDSMLIGSTYTNWHTTNNPGGEIRGALNMTTGVGFTARIDAGQETPPDSSHAVGTGSFGITPGRDTINYSITYYGLSGNTTAGHFHIAPAGAAGGVVKSITGAAGPAMTYTGNWTTTDALQAFTQAYAESLFVGKMYVNFHSSLFAGGEIRGQLLYGSDVVSSVGPVAGALPGQFHLDQNYPNPFNPATVIGFQISKSSQVTLIVYNILGERIATLVDGVKAPGAYQVSFDASRFSSGVYFYRLLADGALLQTRKMMLLK